MDEQKGYGVFGSSDVNDCLNHRVSSLTVIS